ncbi:MAG: hypothetical protein C4K49_02470 [Candidatus Thorarchaeota archaeon]|nr:MAG: hypothetical protein C4K49_02470 [Candidatus Thorarchaeota archaeon]
MFLIAALWNWILAVTFLLLPRIDIDYFLLSGMEAPPTLLWFDSFMGLVFAFGVGFYIVSRSTKENHGVIEMAIFEKIWVFIVGLCYFVVGQASALLLLVVSVDLVFGLLFLEDLMAIRRAQ